MGQTVSNQTHPALNQDRSQEPQNNNNSNQTHNSDQSRDNITKNEFTYINRQRFKKETTNKNNNWEFASVNIRGAKSNIKVMTIEKELLKTNLVILGLAETNLGRDQAKYMFKDNTKYRGFWSETEKKGSGVGMLVHRKIEKYIAKIETFESNVIALTFLLPQKRKLKVIQIYLPSNDYSTRKGCEDFITNCIGEKGRIQMEFLIMGDFNAVHKPHLDRNGNKGKKKPESPIFNIIKELDGIDIYREALGKDKVFTWEERGSKSRIDTIWASANLANSIVNREIRDNRDTLDTDHKTMKIKLNMEPYTREKKRIRDKLSKVRYNLKNTTEENWNNWADRLETSIPNDPSVENEQITIHKMWKNLASIMKSAAELHLTKAATGTYRGRARNISYEKVTEEYKELRTANRIIGNMQNLIKDREPSPYNATTTNKIIEVRKLCEKLNKDLIDITPLKVNKEEWENWVKEIKWKRNSLRKKINGKLEIEKRRQIKENIESRIMKFRKEKKKAIANILERTATKDSIKVIKKRKEEELITEESEVLRYTAEFFKKTRRERRMNTLSKGSRWASIYKPKNINNTIYENLLKEIGMEELMNTIKTRKNNSAGGRSGITYEWFKRMGPRALSHFNMILNRILKEGYIPNDWKLSDILPIPKKEVWENDLDLLRPIALLEAPRKILTKILTDRLGRILLKEEILQPNNWAGLPGGNTEQPIIIANNVLEEARSKGKECWVLFQDMKKAFDSVSKESIGKALHRIRLPEKAINLILDTFTERKGRVITGWGYTEDFETKGGLDQGDVWSPLLWRIFYDPLIEEININGGSYKMATRWEEGLDPMIERSLNLKVGALVYMDDSTWIGSSETDLRKSLEIAEEFFELNDIQINTKKTKLITINKSKRWKSIGITHFVGEKIIAEDPKDAIRLLGIWISEAKGKKHQKMKIKQLIGDGARLIRRKLITQEIARYLINQVLMPAVEYMLTDLIINKQVCTKLQAKLQGAFKKKAGLAKTVENIMIQNKEGYNIFDIGDRQLIATCKRFKRILEDNSGMGESAIIRLRQEQTKRGREENIFLCQDLNLKLGKRKCQLNLLADMLELLKAQDCTFHIGLNLQETFKSGRKGITLAAILGEEYHNARANINRWGVKYLEHLLSPEGNRIMIWEEINPSNKKVQKRKAPKWYTRVIELVSGEGNILTELWQAKVDSPHPIIRDNKRKLIKDIKWIASLEKGKLTIEKKRKRGPQEGEIIAKHYKSSHTNKLISACAGCEIGNAELRKEKEKKEECIYQTEIDRTISPRVKKDTSIVTAGHSQNWRITQNPRALEIHLKTSDEKKRVRNREKKKEVSWDLWENLHTFRNNPSDPQSTGEASIKKENWKVKIQKVKGKNKKDLSDRIIRTTTNKGERNHIYQKETKLLERCSTPEGIVRILADQLENVEKSSEVTVVLEEEKHRSILRSLAKRDSVVNKKKNRSLQPQRNLQRIITDNDIKLEITEEKENREWANDEARLILKEQSKIEKLGKKDILIGWKGSGYAISPDILMKDIIWAKRTEMWIKSNSTQKWLTKEKAQVVDWKRSWKEIINKHKSLMKESDKESKTRKESGDNANIHADVTPIRMIYSEIPCLEKLQKRNPSIYDANQKCSRCKQTEEDFEHIWSCEKSANLIQEMGNAIEKGLREGLKKDPKNKPKNKETPIKRLWPEAFTSNDFIRGLYPLSWTKLIESEFSDPNDAQELWGEIARIRNEYTYKIWQSRCKAQAEQNETSGANAKLKKEIKRRKKKKAGKNLKSRKKEPQVEIKAKEKNTTRFRRKTVGKGNDLRKWLEQEIRNNKTKPWKDSANTWLEQRFNNRLCSKKHIYNNKYEG
jgi:hypothetical protein